MGEQRRNQLQLVSNKMNEELTILVIEGRWRSRGFVNMLGWRIQLWRRSGRVNERIVAGAAGKRIRLGDQLYLDVTVNLKGASVRASAFGHEAELFNVGLIPNGVQVPLHASWNGNEFKGTATLTT